MKRLWPLLLLLGFTVGCAKQKFAYPALVPKASSPGARSLAVLPMTDSRTNRSLDKVMVPGFLGEVTAALVTELQATGKFREVSTNLSNAELRLEPTLMKLHWFVPDYGKKTGTAFVSGLFGGIIGGSIYLSLKDNAYGHAEMRLRFTEAVNGTVLAEKTYRAEHTERLANGSIDTPTTQARLARTAFQKAMEQLKADLPTFAP